MKNIIIAIASFLIALSINTNAQEIDLKEASKMAKINAKEFKKQGINKVMFVEFFGEYTTSKETAPGPMESRYSSFVSKRTQQIDIGSDYYENLTNEVYEIVCKIFTDNGIEVLKKEELINNEDYIALGLKEEKKTRGYTGGVTKKSVTTKGVVRSVTGMGMFSETLQIGDIIKINNMVPKIAHDTKCQAAITVKFKYGIGKKNEPTLDFINIKMQSKLDEFNAGRGKKTYAFKLGTDIFLTTNGIKGDNDFIENGTEINLEKYNETMANLAKKMASAYSVLLSNELKK